MKQMIGGILIAIGIMIAGASGLCSLAVLFGSWSNVASMIPVVLTIGGVPFAAGIGMIFGGRALIRQYRQAQLDSEDVSQIFE